MYVFTCIMSYKRLWRQLATDQLDFRLRCYLSYNTRDFGFIPVSLVETDKYIELTDWNLVTAKKKMRSSNKNA